MSLKEILEQASQLPIQASVIIEALENESPLALVVLNDLRRALITLPSGEKYLLEGALTRGIKPIRKKPVEKQYRATFIKVTKVKE